MNEPKRLYRSTNNKVLAGVCGGIGEYFNVDPVIIRILMVILTCFFCSGILIYIAAIFIIPLPQTTVTNNTYYNQQGQQFYQNQQGFQTSQGGNQTYNAENQFHQANNNTHCNGDNGNNC